MKSKISIFVLLLISFLTFPYVGLNGAIAADIVIDNLNSANVSFTGSWKESGGQFEWAGSSYYGRDGDAFSFNFVPPETGPYLVHEWHSLYNSRSTNVLMTIEHDDSADPTERTVNQQIGGQSWNLLGEFNFTAGNLYRVTIIGQPGPSSTSADAVMFRAATGNSPPVANNEAVTAVSGIPLVVDVLVNDTDPNGDASIDETSIAIVGLPSHGNANPQSSGTVIYTPNSGFAGSDAFSYTVKDDQGATSNTATVAVTVQAASADIIIDNLDSGNVSTSGSWKESGGQFEWDGSSYYGRDGDTFSFNFVPPQTGSYQVHEWHSLFNSRSTNVLMTIEHDGTAVPAERTVNQQIGGQSWNLLGEFNFIAGKSVQSYDCWTTRAFQHLCRCGPVQVVSGNQQPPIAAFSGTPTSGNAPLTTQFSDQSAGATSWAWDFNNDGVVDSTVQNPSYQYPAAGIYTVKLTATNTVDSDEEIKTNYITVNEPQQPPVADFSGTPSNGSAPLTVQFTNQSTGATSWAWDFNNDGVVDSTVQSPSFRYTAAGTYSVKLTATNNAGSDDEIKPGYISVTGSGQTVQHVYALPIFDVYYSYFRKALIEIGATQVNQEDWTYRNAQGQDYIVHVVQNDPERIKEILRCNGCDIVMAGHSNYGSGHAPSSDAENAAGRLYGILYVDDPGIVKMTSPFFDGNTSGIRSHFDPGWQPNYISGESAIMPFGFFDPSGESPPYNYEIPYKIGTNPTCYSTGLERMLPESDAVAWFDPDCGVPDPTEPGDWQYFITADVAYRVGSWTTGAAPGDYGSNYYYTGPGGGGQEGNLGDQGSGSRKLYPIWLVAQFSLQHRIRCIYGKPAGWKRNRSF